ncbi:MAG TPA: LemA family protein [Longimicrobium sp.]|nr:LemA family protein [Longimicrobium sp.]
MGLYIGIAAAVLVALLVIVAYNRLVGLHIRSQNAWSDIDVQLKRRHDLVPNLVETVKGYAAHERDTLASVTEARTRAVAVRDAGPAERATAEGQLTAALHGLSVAVEAYPELQASGGFRDLQSQLGQIEEAVQNARRYYNAVVRELNTKVMQFPSNLVAGLFRFRPREFFEAQAAEREVPRIGF